MSVRIGEVVLFSAYAGNEVELDGETYLILSEDDVFGTVS